MNYFLTKVFGSENERTLKKIVPLAQEISALEPEVEKLSDEQLRLKTQHFQEKLAQGATEDDILPEAFAVVREASKRTTKMRHFDVQLIGGIVLHQGKIAEMATGEGKTLVATLPAYLNALTKKGVHVVTVNDYLARRDAEWMGPIYKFLGLTVGVIQHDSSTQDRQAAYHADITFGTNNEFGFDYLRDNMKYDLRDYVQREHHYAIVDEVDSILIDEARTPLIISGPAEESTDKYYRIDRIIPRLKKDADYTVDEKANAVSLTEEGIVHAERLLGIQNLYDPNNMDWLHHIHQALKAHALFELDVDYVVKDGQVLIVDEFTGRLMPGRRYSDGLHQALEAKENVKIESENQTLATITLQNYFRMYKKLAGMTGTAETEAVEFGKIYNLDVVVIPTNRDLIRLSYSDVVYRTEKEKFNAAVEEIKQMNATGRPVLVGTVSIEKSERLSTLLKRTGIKHVVLNAKYHEKEAEIVAEAGKPGAVTIATNMAGRGTDIVLGPGIADLGGLHIIATERHEARRIDNQLRGRAGRQGDPGSSRFYLSLEDDLMRIFGSDRISPIMQKLGMEEGVPIEHKLVTRSIEHAQKQVEGRNFEIRKHLLEYDDVMNKQREAVYGLRRKVLEEESHTEYIMELCEDILKWQVDERCPQGKDPQDWDVEALVNDLRGQFGMDVDPEKIRQLENPDNIYDFLYQKLEQLYSEKKTKIGPERWAIHERLLMLHVIDSQWKDHLYGLDHLKEGIGFRGYGQRDPLIEYKKESFALFEEMMNRMEEEIVKYVFMTQPPSAEDAPRVVRAPKAVQFSGPSLESAVVTAVRKGQKVGRNDPCPCGSGQKYKKCCGVNA
ncbi:preprotein translocase subunit SecA [bacterium]|nr:preprotein translocase subunit SecA [bacterium]MCI0605082.1 preprotein translocase subunit SecA [bacterium]